MTGTLHGKYETNGLNLTGKNGIKSNTPSIKIKNIKERILNDYLIPVFTKQWNIIKENIYFIPDIQKKLNYYYGIYKLDELVVYIELIKVLQLLIEEHNILEDTERNIQSKRDPNEIVSFMFKTSMIKLLPEYEIYDSIIGKPKRELKQKYNEDIIREIKMLLSQENTSYKKIKDHLAKNYAVTF
jgi:hypothetical protein